MTFSGKSKKITLFFLLLLLLLCFLATTWFLVTRSYRDVGFYQQALQEYKLGETQKAKERMQNVIRDDWNNELAIVTLAEWFDADREWNFSSWLWLRAASLNTFKPEYLKNAQQAFFRCRAFQEAFNAFEQGKNPLSESETLQYAYAALSIGESKRAQELFDKVKTPELLQSPLGRLLDIYLPYDKEKPKEKTFDELTALLDCGDDFIVFECLATSTSSNCAFQTAKKPSNALNRPPQSTRSAVSRLWVTSISQHNDMTKQQKPTGKIRKTDFGALR